MSRGIIEPSSKFTDPKQLEAYALTNVSSFLNEERTQQIQDKLVKLNKKLVENTEEKLEIEYEAATIDYKQEIFKSYKWLFDPFNNEIVDGKIDYEQNPAEPNKPT